LIDTRQNLQSIQPTFPETGILFYSTGALSVTLHDPLFFFLILNCVVYEIRFAQLNNNCPVHVVTSDLSYFQERFLADPHSGV
jgi:hypothetical protein